LSIQWIRGEYSINSSFSTYCNLATTPEPDVWLCVFVACVWIYKSVDMGNFNGLVFRNEFFKK